MSIHIIYFASLRDSLGKSQDQVEFQPGLTVHALWQQLNGSQPNSGQILVAINQEYADFDSLVKDQDEVAFFPPVTGG